MPTQLQVCRVEDFSGAQDGSCGSVKSDRRESGSSSVAGHLSRGIIARLATAISFI